LEKLGHVYDWDVKVEIITQGSMDKTHETHVGLDRHMQTGQETNELCNKGSTLMTRYDQDTTVNTPNENPSS
jgi:hypothetical protein